MDTISENIVTSIYLWIGLASLKQIEFCFTRDDILIFYGWVCKLPVCVRIKSSCERLPFKCCLTRYGISCLVHSYSKKNRRKKSQRLRGFTYIIKAQCIQTSDMLVFMFVMSYLVIFPRLKIKQNFKFCNSYGKQHLSSCSKQL